MSVWLGPTGAAAGGGSGEGAIRTALQSYLERLPEPFVMLDIEGRIQERTPYVVVALQEVRAVLHTLVFACYVQA